MRNIFYKRVFIVISYLLFLICLLISDVDNWIFTIIILGVYSSSLHYCYAYIFDVDMVLNNATLTLKSKYGRIFIFLCGISIILSILFSLSGFYEILDFNKLLRVTE
jgi:hypothetical protein